VQNATLHLKLFTRHLAFLLPTFVMNNPPRGARHANQQGNEAADQAPPDQADAPLAFALNPAMANQQGLLNYATKEGMTLYRSNTRCLYSDTSLCFSAQAEGLHGFLNHIVYHTREAGWREIFEVPINNNLPAGETLPFLTHFGQFDMQHLTTFANTYVGGETRLAQNNFQAVTAIMGSMNEAGLAKINPWRHEFTLNEDNIAVVLLLVMILRSEVVCPGYGVNGPPAIGTTPDVAPRFLLAETTRSSELGR
jgi:hypothetical protein